MPHCFKLPRRIAKFRPDWERSTLLRSFRLCHVSPLALLAAVPLLLLPACSETDAVSPPQDPPVANADSAGPPDSLQVALTDTTGDGVNLAMITASTGTTIYPGQD